MLEAILGTPSNSTASDSTPSNSTASDSAPSNGAPSNGAPSNGAPSNGTPGDSTPSDRTPGNSTPGDSTPGNSTPGSSALSNAPMSEDTAASNHDFPRPEPDHDGATASDSPPAHAGSAGVEEGLTVRGSVHLTIPLTTWLGLSAAPGEIAGFGPADAATCRELAERIAASGGSRWCVTLTDQTGRAVAHGCARRPPPDGPTGRDGPASRDGPPDPSRDGPPDPSRDGPPDSSRDGPPDSSRDGPPDPSGDHTSSSSDYTSRDGPMSSGNPARLGDKTHWLAHVRISPIEAGVCTHAREVAGYRIPASLHHIVKIRQRTCSFPGCRRAARRCDDDHTLPHDQGGRTCECNLAPSCKR